MLNTPISILAFDLSVKSLSIFNSGSKLLIRDLLILFYNKYFSEKKSFFIKNDKSFNIL
ncbi:hypothetical protein N9316_03775 [Candidatus Pelagibacter ubique]|nr:hypothetical protein [Candidatus Pelagibacter ubique]